MGYRIFITGSGIVEEAKQLLTDENCVFETGNPKDTAEDIAEKLKSFNPDGLIVRQGKITKAVQSAALNLKVICKHGVGTDNIDIAAATQRGIPVLYTPNANYESVAEHALALLLALARCIPLQDRRIRDGVFDKTSYGGVELFGKTLGIIGFGRTGRRLAELVAPFNMKVLVFHPSCTDEPLPSHVTKVPYVEDIYSQANFISYHCPFKPDTKGMLNLKAITQMKQGTYIVNTSRGGIVAERDLAKALRDKCIRGAALDVFEEEPLADDNPLLTMDNVILTPHVGGSSDNSLKNMGIGAVKNILSVLKGESIDRASLVNKEVF